MEMSHYFYITPEEYAKAETNGVDSFNLERRIHLLGWSKEKAMTKQLKTKTDREKWTKIAESNGIKHQTFMSRVNIYGMSEEESATKPLQDRKLHASINAEIIRKFPKKYVDLADKNGIPYHTFRARVMRGWEFDEAATKPKVSKREAGILGAKRYEEIHGRFHQLIFKQ
ncbi:MAG: hypothetical protein K0S80_3933 [Neobacillus sp.]|nr:hypothetical protein [Neobacillus sp.]